MLMWSSLAPVSIVLYWPEFSLELSVLRKTKLLVRIWRSFRASIPHTKLIRQPSSNAPWVRKKSELIRNRIDRLEITWKYTSAKPPFLFHPLKSHPRSRLSLTSHHKFSMMAQLDKSFSPHSDRSSNCSSDPEQREGDIMEQATEDGWCGALRTESDHDPWVDTRSLGDPFNDDQQRSNTQSSDPNLLDEKEYYERYSWDSPEFMFNGSLDSICNTMDHFRISMEAERDTKEKLKRLHDHKHGQFDDAEEMSTQYRATSSSLQGRRNKARTRRCRMAPYWSFCILLSSFYLYMKLTLVEI